ncbi:MAG: CDP-glycerol glycerophosphotransferase family protein [Eubacterium sp.]
MQKVMFDVEKFNITNGIADIDVSFTCDEIPVAPRVSILFTDGEHNRRIPMPVKQQDNKVVASGSYELAYVFYGYCPKSVKIDFVFSDGISTGELVSTDLKADGIKKSFVSHLLRTPKRELAKSLTGVLFSLLALPFRLLKIKNNRVSFFSNRTSEPVGNLKAVYDTLKQESELDIHIACASGGAKATLLHSFKFMYLYMTSRVVYIDDYYHLISYIKKKKGTCLIQLWHGVGAFKTFGFSRIHKDSKLQMYSANHRQYDYAVVSSPDVCDYYAEAFGIDRQKVLPLGSPRCDILLNEAYQNSVREKFYSQFPNLKGKKILLFAPTFRGGGNGDCYYPTEKFNVDRVLETLGEEWAVVIKLHPYLTEKFTCSKANESRMADCFSWDVNDVIIVSDFLVTDYSSVIFEAALLEKPMVFLAFDEEEFADTRDSFLEFSHFVPSNIVKTDVEAAKTAKDNLVDMQKIKGFKNSFFGESSNACENVKNLTFDIINKK